MAVKFLDDITVDGDVGIGTNSPSHPLSVISSYPQIKIQQNGQTPYFTFGSGSGFAVFDGVGTSGALLDIRDDGNSRMRIDAAGNVGIGTTTPIAYTNYSTLTIDGSSGAVLRLDKAANDNQFEIAVSGAFTYLKNINSKDLWFGTNNTERMRIKSSGNVGIGTTSPNRLLTVQTTSSGSYLALNSSSNNTTIGSDVIGAFIVYDDTASAYRMVVKPTTGNIGIGTTNPQAKLEVNDSSNDIQMRVGSLTAGISPQIRLQGKNTANTTNYFADIELDAENGKLIFNDPGTSSGSIGQSPMVLDSSGNVGIGTTNPVSQLHIKKSTTLGPIIQLENAYNGSGADTLIRFGDSTENYSYSVGSDDSANSFRISYNGTSYNGAVPGTNDFLIFNTSGNAEIPNGDLKVTLGSIAVGNITNSTTNGRIDTSNDIVAYSTSDIRLKDNIKTIDKALDKVNSIQGVEFDWIEKEEVHGNKGHDIGVIAQEIEKILPDVVTTRDSGYKAVKYEKIVPLLIEAIKDLSKQVDGLKRLI